MRIWQTLKEWAITFLLKSWLEKGKGSLVMVVIGFAKEKSQRAQGTHSSSWDNFGNTTMFLYFFYLFSPLDLNSNWCLHCTDRRGWLSIEGSCKYDCQSTLDSLIFWFGEKQNLILKTFPWNLILKVLASRWKTFVSLYYSFGNGKAVWDHIQK